MTLPRSSCCQGSYVCVELCWVYMTYQWSGYFFRPQSCRLVNVELPNDCARQHELLPRSPTTPPSQRVQTATSECMHSPVTSAVAPGWRQPLVFSFPPTFPVPSQRRLRLQGAARVGAASSTKPRPTDACVRLCGVAGCPADPPPPLS